MSSGIGAATWITFLPFALAFGLASERWGVHAAGWLFTAVAAAVSVLLVFVVTSRRRPATEPVVPAALAYAGNAGA